MWHNSLSLSHFTVLPNCLLKQAGASVRNDQIKEPLDWILKFCPQFPEEGIWDAETQERVRQILQKEPRQAAHIPGNVFLRGHLLRPYSSHFGTREIKVTVPLHSEA